MLPTPEQIQRYIADGLPCDHVEVEGDGQHFYATIVSPAFEGQGLDKQMGKDGARRSRAGISSRRQSRGCK